MRTKAISKYNVAVTVQSGKVGNVRYVQKGGQTYVRAAHNQSINNPRTESQMRQRLKFASLSSLYSEFAALNLLRRAFQFKPANQSDYNAFMQINQGMGVYFKKQQMQSGACVALPVVVSNGSLPQISADRTGTTIYSNISVGDLDFDEESTSVAEVSRAIIKNNRSFKNGDAITCVELAQQEERTGDLILPWVIVSYYKFVLDTSATGTPFQEAFPDFSIDNAMLVKLDFDEEGCYGFVHTSKDKISKCRLTDANEDFRQQYDTDRAFEIARETYGTSEEAVLFDNNDTGSDSTVTWLPYCQIDGQSPFVQSTTVTITSPTPGATIRYTTDGTMVKEDSQVYTEPFTINNTTVVSARAFKDGLSSKGITVILTKTSGNDD